MLTTRNFIIGILAVGVVAAGIAAFTGLKLGGGGGETAEAHAVYTRYLTGYNLPNGQSFYFNAGGFWRQVSDDGGGCVITLASGLVLIPEGATQVTVPDGTVITSPESNGCTTTVGDVYPRDLTSPMGVPNVMRQRGNFTVSVGSATTTINSVPREHHHSGVAVGVTGTGFYCGRRYDWSEFAPDENRALFMTASRVSMIGWVWVDADGQQIAHCTGYRPIFRPADQ